jgi:hypothetical protein
VRRRLLVGDEIARGMHDLASNDSAMVTSDTLSIDGGMSG